jgi:hypothetical protein
MSGRCSSVSPIEKVAGRRKNAEQRERSSMMFVNIQVNQPSRKHGRYVYHPLGVGASPNQSIRPGRATISSNAALGGPG